jgi:hypothetical protein
MRLQTGCVDLDSFLFDALGGQTLHHPGKDSHLTPALLTVVKCLRQTILTQGVAPAQAVAIKEDYFAQYMPLISTPLFVKLDLHDRPPSRKFLRTNLAMKRADSRRNVIIWDGTTSN